MKNETKKKIKKGAATLATLPFFIAGAVNCGGDNGKDPDKPKPLTGTVNISGILEVGKEATIEIADSNGTAEKFTYQWTRKNGGIALEIEDATGKSYTITEGDIGHYLGAIVKNADTIDSIFGEAKSKVIDVAKEQTVKVDIFGGASSVTVTGTMLNAEWEGVADKIASRLNATFNGAPANERPLYIELFARGVTYIVEVSPEGYTRFKTTGDGKTVYIALSHVDTGSVIDGLNSIYTNGITVALAPTKGYTL
jgi:hypothetical protein